MRLFRIAGFALVFGMVVVGWIFVLGILRYGSVENFGARMWRVRAVSHTPAQLLLPAPESVIALAKAPNPLEAAITATTRAQKATPVVATIMPAAEETKVSSEEYFEAAAVETPSPATEPLTLPTDLPTDLPTELPTEQVATTASSIALTDMRHEWQTWNNCGPATLATYLSYYGSTLGQAQIGGVLRRSEDDKNVSPEELREFAQSRGMQAILRVNGNASMLKALVSDGFPVLIETWLEEHPNDGMGHYRLVTGYDDARGAWTLYDSYVSTNLVAGDGDDYAGIWLDYTTADAWWKVFNRTFMLVYPEQDAELIAQILADELGVDQWQAAEQAARAEIAASEDDAFAWFNLGSALWQQGRSEEAAAAFDRARSIGLPWRMLWYQFAIFPTYLEAGRPNDVLALADATLANTNSVEEVHYWRGRALEALGDAEGARAAYTSALALYPDYADAATALSQLD